MLRTTQSQKEKEKKILKIMSEFPELLNNNQPGLLPLPLNNNNEESIALHKQTGKQALAFIE